MPPPLQFPVSTFVKKYLEYHLGLEYKLSEADHFGLMLYHLLRRQREDKNDYDSSLKNFNEKFAVRVVHSFFIDHGCTNFTSHTIYKFNTFVESLIKAEFHAFVENHREFGLKQNQAIYEFCEKYDFQDDDISFDRLMKSYQRYKAAKEKRLLEKSPCALSCQKSSLQRTFAA